MSEQQPVTTVQAAGTSACPHPEAVGTRWGDPISEERQAELQGYIDRWKAEANHRERKGPFDKLPRQEIGVVLTGAEMSWLAEQSVPDKFGLVRNLHLEGAQLFETHLEGATLDHVHLEGANLGMAHLERASLDGTHLEGAALWDAHLEGASLIGAHLEGSFLHEAHLEGADLREVWFDSKSVLISATLNDKTSLGDVRWGGVGSVELTSIKWAKIKRLGDEHDIGKFADAGEHDEVVRAYRQVAAQLRAQGMGEVADRFLYRAQVCQRRVLLRRFRIPQYLGSLILDLISGYGYRPMRSLIAYVVIIAAFTGAYLLNAQFAAPHLTWDEALVLSISAFHGRGFFTSGISLGDTLARLAAGEAIIGLLIEITFIATFTQRFFAR